MFDKVVLLSEADAVAMYREPIHINKSDGRIVLRTARLFQEYLGMVGSKEGTMVIKGKRVRVNLNFPNFLPDQKPMLNWFQMALKKDIPLPLADPLGCKARYMGMLPGYFHLREILDIPSEFVLQENPRCETVNYALFIYDRADYSEFLEGVTKFLEGHLHGEQTKGDKILVADDTAQPMILIPTNLLIGGKEYLAKTWESLVERR